MVSPEKQIEWAEQLENALDKVKNSFYHPGQQDKIKQVVDELKQENTTNLCKWQEDLRPFITDFHRNSYPYAVNEIYDVYNKMNEYIS